MDENWKYYHELGHGVIAHIFDGYFLKFEYLTFELDNKKFNSRDEGYTYSSPLDDKNDIVQNDIQMAVLVDGLYLLSGIVGATYLEGKSDETVEDISSLNYRKILDLRGSDGDFEIINNGIRPYGWYFNQLDYSKTDKINFNCKLYNILKTVFKKSEVHFQVKKLYDKLKVKKTLYPKDFQEVFNSNFTEMIKSEILTLISKENFGDITNINYDRTK